MNPRRQGIIFDLDDTLVDTSDVYWHARSEFIAVLASEGINEEIALEAFESTDTEMIGQHGHIPERYGLSMHKVYEDFLRRGALERSASVESRIAAAAQFVPITVPSPIDGSFELLSWAHDRYDLALLTRGVPSLQHKKIEKWGLGRFFKSISIVQAKGPREFLQAADALELMPADCWAIGDSIRSDINPALQAGIRAILFVYRHHTYHWRQEYGVAPSGPYYRVDKLADTIDILSAPAEHSVELNLEALVRSSSPR